MAAETPTAIFDGGLDPSVDADRFGIKKLSAASQ